MRRYPNSIQVAIDLCGFYSYVNSESGLVLPYHILLYGGR